TIILVGPLRSAGHGAQADGMMQNANLAAAARLPNPGGAIFADGDHGVRIVADGNAGDRLQMPKEHAVMGLILARLDPDFHASGQARKEMGVHSPFGSHGVEIAEEKNWLEVLDLFAFALVDSFNLAVNFASDFVEIDDGLGLLQFGFCDSNGGVLARHFA